jgi:hypothetical protein
LNSYVEETARAKIDLSRKLPRSLPEVEIPWQPNNISHASYSLVMATFDSQKLASTRKSTTGVVFVVRLAPLKQQASLGERIGLGAPTDDDQGKARRSWVFGLVLSYSHKGYGEAFTRQETETFLRCLENGLRSFGGSPKKKLNICLW